MLQAIKGKAFIPSGGQILRPSEVMLRPSAAMASPKKKGRKGGKGRGTKRKHPPRAGTVKRARRSTRADYGKEEREDDSDDDADADADAVAVSVSASPSLEGLVDYVDFGEDGNCFLKLCGARTEPTPTQLAELLMSNHQRFFTVEDGRPAAARVGQYQGGWGGWWGGEVAQRGGSYLNS